MTDLFFNVNRMNTAIDVARNKLSRIYSKRISPIISFMNIHGYSYDHTTVLILTELFNREIYPAEKLCELFGAENLQNAKIVSKVLQGDLDDKQIPDVAKRVLICIVQQQLTQHLLGQCKHFDQTRWLTKDECLVLINHLDNGG